MWDLAVREDDYAAVDAMLRRFSGAPLSYRVVPAHARRDTAAIRRVHDEARSLDARQSQIAARFVATYLEDFPAAAVLALLDLQPRRNAAIRLGAQTFLAWLEVARGRWRSARQAFDDAERMDGGQAVHGERALAATLPFLAVPRDDLARIRAQVESWNPSAEPVPGATPLASALRPHLRLYLLGLLSARLGAGDAAIARARELERLAVPPHARSVIAGLAATVRADVALRRTRPDEALALLRDATGQIPLELVMVKPFVNAREYTQEHARYLRAEALIAKGRDDDARRWLETSFQGSPAELVYLAPAHLRLSQIDERGGNVAQAVAHLQRFTELWKDADPALQPQVIDAGKALRRLRER